MNIGLIDADRTKFPNLALMKISTYHKKHNDKCEMYKHFTEYDRIYVSRVFDDCYSSYIDPVFTGKPEVIHGGTGYSLDNKLPDEIEHMYPDYSLYGINDTAYGYLSRGCPRACPFCIVSKKEGRKSIKVADLKEFWSGQKNIVLLDPNILACRDYPDLLEQLANSGSYVDFTQGIDSRLLTRENIEMLNKIKIQYIHFAWDLPSMEESVLRGLKLYSEYGKITNYKFRTVYILTNYNTEHDYDLYRVNTLKELGYYPYIMIYNKPSAPRLTRLLQGYCNNRYVYTTCKKFDDFLKSQHYVKGDKQYRKLW